MRGAALVLLAAAAGCELVHPPLEVTLEPRTQLYSLLREGTDTVSVLIERTGSEDGFLRVSPVSGAEVRIAGPHGEVALREAPAGFPQCVVKPGDSDPARPAAIGPGCYAGLVPGGVRAGATYTLAVALPDGAAVEGRTTVPLPPEPLSPAPDARIPLRRYGPGPDAVSELLTVRWRSPSAGSQVAPLLRPGAVYAAGQAAPAVDCPLFVVRDGEEQSMDGRLRPLAEDSMRVRARTGYCWEADTPPPQKPVVPDSVEGLLRLTAVDAGYATYLERRGDGAVREETAAVGLRGAYGVFGSFSSAHRRMMFVLPAP